MLFSGGGGDTIPSVSTPGELKSCTHRTSACQRMENINYTLAYGTGFSRFC
jgi:hypothetical protein